MSNELAKTDSGGGVLPAVASGLLPGLGQLINGQTDKAIGVAVSAAATGLVIAKLPLMHHLGHWAFLAVWVYAVGDAFFTRRKKA